MNLINISATDNYISDFYITQDLAFAEQKKYYFAHDISTEGHKKYKGFDSHDEIFKRIYELIEPDRNFYQIMKGEWVEFYDIDGKWDDVIFADKSLDDIKNDFLYIRKLFLSENLYNIFENDGLNEVYIWRESCDEKKVSLHLTIRNGYKFRNADEIKTYTVAFQKFITENSYSVKFDKSIYTKNRPLRMLGCCKQGSNRILKTDSDVNMELHCANYFTGDEKFVDRMDGSPMCDKPFEFKSEKRIDKSSVKELDKAIENKQAVADGDIEKLVELILESIENEEHSLCDTETPNRMCYDDFKSLAFAVIRVKEGKCKTLFFKIFDYYRHNGDYKRETIYNNMRKYINYGWGLGSLHYWARENPRYDEVFETQSLLRKYLTLKKKFERQLLEQENREYNNYGDYELFLKNKPIVSLKAIQKWARQTITEISNSGRTFFVVKNQVFDTQIKCLVEKYVQNVETVLVKKNVRIFNDDYVHQKERWDSLSDKERLDYKRHPQPRMIYSDWINGPLGGIINAMAIENELPTAQFVVNVPYFRKEPHFVKGNFNTFRGFQLINNNHWLDNGNSAFENSATYNHLKNYLCPEPEIFEYYLNYIAHMIQKPAELPGTAMLFFSKPGCGKDLIIGTGNAKMIGYQYYVNFGDMNDFVGHFTADQNGKLLSIINELAEGEADNVMFKKSNVIKDKITRVLTKVEFKGKDPYWVDHTSRYIFFTNHEKSITVGNADRRYNLVECKNDMNGNRAYFDTIVREIEDMDFIKSMFSYYANRDISSFRPMNIIETNYKKNNKILNLDNVHRFLLTMFDDYELENEFFIQQEDLYQFWEYHRKKRNFGVLKHTTFCDRIKHALPIFSNKNYSKEELRTDGFLMRIFNMINTQGYQEKLLCDGLRKRKGFYINRDEIYNYFKAELKVDNLVGL